MAYPVKLFLVFGVLVALYFVLRSMFDRMIDSLSRDIVRYLKSREAFGPMTAIEVPVMLDVKTGGSIICYFHKRAMKELEDEDLIFRTNQGKYFVKL